MDTIVLGIAVGRPLVATRRGLSLLARDSIRLGRRRRLLSLSRAHVGGIELKAMMRNKLFGAAVAVAKRGANTCGITSSDVQTCDGNQAKARQDCCTVSRV